MQYSIAGVSFGKDSVCMVLELIARRYPLHEVVFYNTGMEFLATYAMRDKLLPILVAHNIRYTELHPRQDFLYMMFEKPVNGRDGFHLGYSWCGGRCRWGTAEKIRVMDRYVEERGALLYVGIAADETRRLEKERKPYKRFPLAQWGISESKALSICYAHGFDWMESCVRLYDILSRVSCWCCANKNLRELENIYRHLPEYWQRLRYLQSRTDRPMKGDGKSVFQLEQRFAAQWKPSEPAIWNYSGEHRCSPEIL